MAQRDGSSFTLYMFNTETGDQKPGTHKRIIGAVNAENELQKLKAALTPAQKEEHLDWAIRDNSGISGTSRTTAPLQTRANQLSKRNNNETPHSLKTHRRKV